MASNEQHDVIKLTARDRIERIYQEIRERICLMKYPPGTLLGESELADEFNCSRSPIREVIKRLDSELLVVSKNGVGTMVTGAKFDNFRDIYEMRLKVSELIGVLSPKAFTKRNILELETLLIRAQALNCIADSLNELAKINHELHYWMLEIIGNTALKKVYDLYYFQTARTWYTMMPDLGDEEIQALRSEISELLAAAKRNDHIAVGYIKRNYVFRIYDLLIKANVGGASGL